MIYLDTMTGEYMKKEGYTRGEDYAVCNGNPNKFIATPRKEYEKQESGMDSKTGLAGRQPL